MMDNGMTTDLVQAAGYGPPGVGRRRLRTSGGRAAGYGPPGGGPPGYLRVTARLRVDRRATVRRRAVASGRRRGALARRVGRRA